MIAENSMPVHDWTRVEAGIFHAFHHEWITEIGRALNRGILPPEFYALPEQQAAGFGPDILTLQTAADDDAFEIEFYRRKKSSVVIRHVGGDRIVAIVEIVSPGNKHSRQAFQEFLSKSFAL